MEVPSTKPISVTLPVGEALYAIDAIAVASAEAWRKVRRMTETQAPIDEREIAEMAATYLDRAHKRLDCALFPMCRYLQDEDCERAVAAHDERGVPYCAVHFEHVQRIRAAVR